MKSENHKREVSQLDCAECGIGSYSQAAHPNSYALGKGMGLKANDLFCFPLCCTRPGEVGCHVRHDQLIGMTRDEAEQREYQYIVKTLSKLEAEGKLKVK